MKKLELYILIISLTIISQPGHCQHWIKDTIGIFQLSGTNQTTYSFYVNNHKLYVGGRYLTTGYDTNWSIAAWNGINWENFGGGMYYGYIYSMKYYNNELYAGGGVQTQKTSLIQMILPHGMEATGMR
ncbi:MAG: hypothetical protein ABIJ97_01655 [Bacteroidota bacterium]